MDVVTVNSLYYRKQFQADSFESRPIEPLPIEPPPSLEPIYAFRTITTMLSLIQRTGMAITNSEELKSAPIEQVDELKTLDALAAIAVREHEVVAVTANIEGSVIESTSASQSFWDFILSPNPRRDQINNQHDSLTSNNTTPTIVGSAAPSYLKDQASAGGEELLDTFIEQQWGKESFDTHIWMLKNLLERRERKSSRTLQLYVVATCFPKMLRRMKHRTVSRTFQDCLKRVSNFKFVEQPNASSKKNEINSDRLFLDILSKIHTHITTDVSKLMKLAKAAQRTPEVLPEIYTEETCIEFHFLLCELLERFLNSLETLKEYQKSSVLNKETVVRYLVIVRRLGDVLRAMVRGAAIEKHLKCIAPLLLEAEREGEEEEEEEEDTELQGVRPFVLKQGKPLPLWNAYRDWLCLMVIHFDAVQVLTREVSNLEPRRPLNFEILSSPMPDKKMLPWKDLLRKHDYFPELLDGSQSLSVDELIRFLDPDSEPVTGSTKGSIQKNKGGHRVTLTDVKKKVASIKVGDDIASVVQDVRNLDGCTSPVCKPYSEEIIRKIESLKDGTQRYIPEIIEMLETLEIYIQLYTMLKKEVGLRTGDNFLGAPHCELSLATLINISGQPRQNNGLVDNTLLDKIAKYDGPVIGVSKRCCPVCAHVLTILKSKDEKPFIFKGHHSRITACTLPEFLPADVINRTVSEFGRRLRRELVKLKQRTEIVRARTRSTDSRGLSPVNTEQPVMTAADLSDEEDWELS